MSWSISIKRFTLRYAKEKKQETLTQFLEEFFEEAGLCAAEIEDTLERLDTSP